MSILPQTAIDELRASVRGRVWLPADTEFGAVRRPWNLGIEQHACAVVEAADADDIADLVRFAYARNLPVATQPSGHGATGRATDAILLRTARLNSIDIDPAAMTARIGAGVRSGELQRAAAAHGLTGLPGSSPVVTVAGAALGGGLSWFGRSFGWMADSVLSFDVVVADGTVHRVTPSAIPTCSGHCEAAEATLPSSPPWKCNCAQPQQSSEAASCGRRRTRVRLPRCTCP